MKKVLIWVLILAVLGWMGYGGFLLYQGIFGWAEQENTDQLFEQLLQDNGLLSGATEEETNETGELTLPGMEDLGTGEGSEETESLLDLGENLWIEMTTEEQQEMILNEKEALLEKRLQHYRNWKDGMSNDAMEMWAMSWEVEMMDKEEDAAATIPTVGGSASEDDAPSDESIEEVETNESISDEEAGELFEMIESIDS